MHVSESSYNDSCMFMKQYRLFVSQISFPIFFLKVISVAIGTDADPNELEKATTNRKNLIKSLKSEEAKSLGKKVVKIIVKGNEKLVRTSNYLSNTDALTIFAIAKLHFS